MKKIVISSPGGYEKLQIEATTDLFCKNDSVVVSTQAIGVNYADCLVRFGVYESAKKYVGWPTVFFTAYHALFQIVKIYPHSKILIHSAAGGVGSALVQLAKAFDFHVTGVVGSSHKVDEVKALGADQVIDKSTQDLWGEARKVAPEGFDAIFDANGYTTLKEGYKHLRPVGKLISYGAHSLLPQGGGSGRLNYLKALFGLIKTPRFNPLDLITDNKAVVGFNLSFLFARQDLATEAMNDLIRLAHENKIKPLKTTTFKFDDVGLAHQALESGKTIGKVVLVVE